MERTYGEVKCVVCGVAFVKKSHSGECCLICRKERNRAKQLERKDMIRKSKNTKAIKCACCGNEFMGSGKLIINCNLCRTTRKNDIYRAKIRKSKASYYLRNKSECLRKYKERRQKPEVRGRLKAYYKRRRSENRPKVLHDGSLERFYGTVKVTDDLKKQCAFIYLSRRIHRNSISKQAASKAINRIKQGDTIAAYE